MAGQYLRVPHVFLHVLLVSVMWQQEMKKKELSGKRSPKLSILSMWICKNSRDTGQEEEGLQLGRKDCMSLKSLYGFIPGDYSRQKSLWNKVDLNLTQRSCPLQTASGDNSLRRQTGVLENHFCYMLPWNPKFLLF